MLICFFSARLSAGASVIPPQPPLALLNVQAQVPPYAVQPPVKVAATAIHGGSAMIFRCCFIASALLIYVIV